MASLADLRNVPLADRYALLPPPLRSIFERQRTSRRIWGVVRGVVTFGIGAGLVAFEYSPPLSSEERMFIGYGIALMLVSFVFGAWTFVVPDPAIWALTDEDVVWIYEKLVRGGRKYLVLASDRGIDAEVRLDEDGVPLPLDTVRAVVSEVHALHAGLHAGFRAEISAAYAQNPASLRREGGPRPGTWVHVAYRRRVGILWAIIGLVVVFAVVVEPMIRLSGRR